MPGGAAAETPKSHLLVTGARIFDGKSDALIDGFDMLIEGDRIIKLEKNITPPQGATKIDAEGRTLTLGFIAMHEHIIGQMPFGDIFTLDTRYYAYVATQTAETYLMNGFTSVRDVAGNTYSLKMVIDRGYVVGPRIYPSGPMISQTAGHSDHRHSADGTSFMAGSVWDPMVRYGDMMVLDGVPEVLKGVRENLLQGASQIKIAVGGGTGSYADPLEVVEFTPEEIQAAVQAASDYGTYLRTYTTQTEFVVPSTMVCAVLSTLTWLTKKHSAT